MRVQNRRCSHQARLAIIHWAEMKGMRVPRPRTLYVRQGASALVARWALSSLLARQVRSAVVPIHDGERRRQCASTSTDESV